MLKELQIDSGWTLREYINNEAAGIAVPASVPGDLYSDLLRAGRTDDPYYRDNELAALKLSENDYIYEKRVRILRGTPDGIRLRSNFDIR